jgi:hypothetical protein
VTESRAATSRKAFAGVVLVVLGLGLWAVYRLSIGNERHSFAAGAVAPTYVHVTAGKTYHLASPDGVRGEQTLGLDPDALRCTSNQVGQQPGQLSITPEKAGTKATNQIATFVAPVTARLHIDCEDTTSVFVDNADDADPDRAGLWLVLASIMLAVGLPLALSALRRPSAAGPGQHDEVERFVDGTDPVVEHGEVSSTDRLDGGT